MMKAAFNLRCLVQMIFTISCVLGFLNTPCRINLKIVGSELKKATLTPLLASNQGGLDLLQGDNMFKVHSLCATSFGLSLLLFPNVFLPMSDGTSSFICREWSIFILAVAVITFNAPNMEYKTKQLLARTYASMCAAESILQLNSMALSIFNMKSFIVDAVTFAAFGFITFGYIYSGYVFGNETQK
mmetsp:Transcript_25827/g.37063  ORF Transcript_25827/g.37063 Transcript_25827/m.37063 type:complete len:186 (-) Transcript_25827:138-695(-)